MRQGTKKRGDEKNEELLKEQKKTNELLEKLINQNKDPNELLTMLQIQKETGIGINVLQKMFKDKELPVQRYTIPFKVTRKAFNAYLNTRHDYLCKKGENE